MVSAAFFMPFHMMHNHDDLQKLLDILPQEIQQPLKHHLQRDVLVEVVLDLGRRPEARFPGQAQYLSDQLVTRQQLQDCVDRLGQFGGDNRAGIEQTLHRISAIRNRQGEIIGLTCRVGRAIHGTINMIRDLVETGQSILMLGRPGVGKTTALREIARVLADDLNKRVVIIDSSNEIAGDGDIPHPAIGKARRMQVARPELQHQVMIEAVENHMPEVIVIDEIGTELEALAARTIAERGVQLVGTAHGNEIENLIKNPTLSDLVGGIESVTLGDEEARRRGSQKSVLERKAPPTFEIAVEMLERQRWVVHENVAETVDMLLRGRQPQPQQRTLNEQGQVMITKETAATGTLTKPNRPAQVLPFPKAQPLKRQWNDRSERATMGAAWSAFDPIETGEAGLAQEQDDPQMRVYPYAISSYQLEQVIDALHLPIVLTKHVSDADAIVALRSHARKHDNLQRLAKTNRIPLYVIKANTIPHMSRTLRQMLGIDQRDGMGDWEMSLDEADGNDEESAALEEARLAVERVVIPKQQPVELLPRSSWLRKLQHELVERYRLNSHSVGEEPDRRLRIYPA
ncbi:MAG TPA: R3H domain-containing nucleic acid-binding protein [Trichocoleus sp.]|jgi:stage III sporulation protein SpoIIIAA